MRIVSLVLFTLLISTLVIGAEFSQDGSISGKNADIKINPDGQIEITTKSGTKLNMFLSITHPDRGWLSTNMLKNNELLVDRNTKSITWSSIFEAAESEPEFEINEKIELLPDGHVLLKCQIRHPENKKNFGDAWLGLPFNRNFCKSNQSIRIDNNEVFMTCDEELKQTQEIYTGIPEHILYTSKADKLLLCFTTVEIAKANILQLYKKNTDMFETSMSFKLNPENSLVLNFDLDHEEYKNDESNIVGEIDFTPNKFKLPDYSLCRNLVQNPSFENDFYFWDYRTQSRIEPTASYGGDFFSIDNTTAIHGRNSMKIKVISNQNACAPVTFAIPSTKGKKYTLSFWAKTNVDNNVTIETTGFGQGGRGLLGTTLLPSQRFLLSKEWQRHHYTFIAPSKILTIAFVAKQFEQQITNMWIDAVQLEEGDTLTDFTTDPVVAVFKTKRRDNLFEPGETTGSCLSVNSEKPTQGKIIYHIKDFYGIIVNSGEYDFNTNGNFEQVTFPISFVDSLKSGIFVITTIMKAPTFSKESYFRLTKMKFTGNKLKHSFLFSGAGTPEYCDWDRRYSLWEKIGIGSAIFFNPPPHELTKLLGTKGISVLSSIYEGGQNVLDMKYKLNVTGDTKNGVSAIEDSEFTKIEEEANIKANTYPEIKYWKLVNEPMHNSSEIHALARAIKSSVEGIKKSNPAAVIISPDPPGLTKMGIDYLEQYWKECGNITDILAIHPYRNHPEIPDLDKDLESLLKRMDEFSPEVPLWLTEGNYYCTYMIPELGLDAINDKVFGPDHYRGGHFTYDLGFGEKVSLAHCMRYRLMVLKYSNRIKMDVDWNILANQYCQGIDMSPRAGSFVTNTLGNILGNADYISDIAYGENIRAYLFEDDQKRPVAVIWNYNQDIFLDDSLIVKLDFSGIKDPYEVIDILGTVHELPEEQLLPITGYPVFLRGKSGRSHQFQRELNCLNIIGKNSPDFKVKSLFIDGAIRLVVQNLRSKEKSGSLVVKRSGNTIMTDELRLKPLGEYDFTDILPDSINKFNTIKYDFNFTPVEGGESINKSYFVNYFHIPHVSKSFVNENPELKWNGIQPIAISNIKSYRQNNNEEIPYLGDKDLSANFWIGYDADNLYVTVKIKDNIYCPHEEDLTQAYLGDSLQIYFDSFANASMMTKNGYDDDDQSYDISTINGKIQTNRSVAPNIQLAFNKTGIEPNITGSFQKIGDGYIYDLVFPRKTILPIELKSGNSVGFSIMVNDNDNDGRKRGLYINDGDEPFQHPKAYPVMIFK